MKGIIFQRNFSLNCHGKLVDLSKPLVMGILNVTPDSFFKNSRVDTTTEILKRAESILREGASIIDIGGCSTRPGARAIPVQEELMRVLPAIRSIKKEFPDALLSVDTFQSDVADQSIDEGAEIINDVSGGQIDPNIFKVAAARKVPYILSHIKGTPEKMQDDPKYSNVTMEVLQYFAEKIKFLRSLGIIDIILDPGFGFGKNLEHNYTLFNDLPIFKMLELPIMAGISRKSMITRLLDVSPEEALNGTSVLHGIALLKGVNILRVHDVREAVETIKITERLAL